VKLHVARMEDARNAYIILARESEGKRAFIRLSIDGKIILKWRMWTRSV
jgi:hypothetical protein